MKSLSLFSLFILIISCEITHIKEIPESGYFVCDYGDAVTLERNPPTREYLGWEFYNIVGLYYNEKYIIGFKCNKYDADCYFIIRFDPNEDRNEKRWEFDNRNDYIRVRDSLGLSEKKMTLIKTRNPEYCRQFDIFDFDIFAKIIGVFYQE